MLPQTLLDNRPGWFTADSPEAVTAVVSQATLARNIADYPFPARAAVDERQAVIDRVAPLLEHIAPGRLYPLAEFDARELRFLVERRLITRDLAAAAGPKAVHISEDQTLAVMLNGADHLTIRAHLPGLQIAEAGRRVAAVETALAASLDFAFSPRLGYLTAALDNVGTGLKAGVALHLPALAQLAEVGGAASRIGAHRALLRGMKVGGTSGGDTTRGAARGESRVSQSFQSDLDGAGAASPQEASGDLFVVCNDCTLGISEEEIVFNVQHAANALIQAEAEARHRLLDSSVLGVEDRVGRARGIAAGARLLSFAEAVTLLSALRLGVAAGLLPGVSVESLNELLIGAQGAHLELAQGGHVDVLALNQARADLFRACFGGH
jgi:protein arginine kinase